jgi:hypothetical protein
MIQIRYFALLVIVLLTFGCATEKAAQYDSRQLTSVDLTKANYHVLKANAVGTDKGLKVLGIPVVKPSVIKAMGDLRAQAPMEGKAAAVANVIKEESSIWLLLFSIPKVTVSGDIVEFDKED